MSTIQSGHFSLEYDSGSGGTISWNIELLKTVFVGNTQQISQKYGKLFNTSETSNLYLRHEIGKK